MEIIIFNDDNLLVSQIDETVVKARAFIIDDNNEVLLSKYAGIYLLPGGKVEEQETPSIALLRELREEIGIILNELKQEPFLVVKQYNKDYPKRDNITLINRLSETYYFLIKSNQKPNVAKIELLEEEKEGGFETISININDIESLISKNLTSNPRDKYFARELSEVVKTYKKI
jgi:8-oxo-dGTP pyrophosphatase MutT (NUDIX family)